MNRPLCNSVPMKDSQACSRERSIPSVGASAACGNRAATCCRIAEFSVSRLAVVGADHRNVAERVDGEEIAAVSQPFGLGVDLDEARVASGLVDRDPGRHGAGEGREIEVH